MDITPEVSYLATFPTTVLTEPLPSISASPKASPEDILAWENSILNPKNRIDSLAPVKNPKWRIDGCTRMATQFYTIPTFIEQLVPIRIDTFIPPRAQWPPELIDLLDIDSAFLYCDSRIVNFAIAQHILRTLEHWTSEFTTDFQDYYTSLPFGSHIVFENLSKDIRQINVRVVPMHSLERELLSVTHLQSLWPNLALPPTLELTQLSLIRQLHDSISLVRPALSQGQAQGQAHHPDHESAPAPNSQKLILKALLLSPKYLYHELHLLLTLPPHPNITPPPLRLVTKRCRFGGKTGVVGFLTQYHAQGTLRDILPHRLAHGTLRLADQLKWARQLTAALLHMTTSEGPAPAAFHCDLRLDNVLLSDRDDVLLIDFEHRGILAHAAAPEVRWLEYVDLAASHAPALAPPERQRYAGLYEQCVRPCVPAGRRDEEYSGGDRGYYAPWLCLDEREREAAEVFMLGRVLWCIFEGVSAPNAMLGVEYLREPDIEFPAFRMTPSEMRQLVLDCTRGWTPWLGGLRRRGRRLLFGGDDNPDMTAAEAVEKIAACCKQELASAEECLRMWDEKRKQGDENIFERPRLREVAQILSDFENSLPKNTS